MSARVASLRALIIEDVARTADVAGMRSVARLLRRADLCDTDLGAVCADLRAAASINARLSGAALMKIRALSGDDAAVDVLAEFCGLGRDEWIAETAREQGVEVSP